MGGAVVGAVAGTLGARQLAAYSDEWTLLNARIRLVTSSQEQANFVQEKLFKSAQENRTSLEATETLYFRTARAAQSLGRSQNELIKFTDLVNKSLIIGGATTQEATQSTIQLSQALASGRLQGDEFRTVMESMPMVAQAMAKHLGVTTGEMYKLRTEGKLTADKLVESMLAAEQSITEQFKTMPVTIGQSFQILTNSITRFIGEGGKSTGIAQAITKSVMWMADNIKALATVLGYVIIYWGSYTAIVKAATIVSRIKAAVALKTAAAMAAQGVAANAAAAGVSRLAIAGTALRTVFLGPVGIALAIATVITLLLQLESAADRAKKRMEEFRGTLEGLTKEEKQQQGWFIAAEVKAVTTAMREMEAAGTSSTKRLAMIAGTPTLIATPTKEYQELAIRLRNLRERQKILAQELRLHDSMEEKIGTVTTVTDDNAAAMRRRARAIADFKNDLEEMLAAEKKNLTLAGMQGQAQEELRIRMEGANQLLKMRNDLEEKAISNTITRTDVTMLMALAEQKVNEAINMRIQVMQRAAMVGIQNAGEDNARQGQQAIELAFRRGIAQDQLRIKYEAVNKEIEARRTLTGESLTATLANIQAEARLAEQLLLVERLTSDIGDVFENTFERILSDGLSGFRELFDGIKQMFFRLVAEMATDALLQQIRKVVTNNVLNGMTAAGTASAASGGPAAGAANAIVLEGLNVVAESKQQQYARYARTAGAGLAGFAVGNSLGGSTTSLGGGGVMGGLGGAATGFMMAGPMGALAGGLMGVAGGIMGAWNRQKEVARMNREVMQRNTAKLTELRESIDGSPLMSGKNLSNAGPLLEAIRALGSAGGVRGAIERVRISTALKGGDSGAGLKAFEQATGLTTQQLARMAQQMGIELFNEEGKLVAGALGQLAEALDLAIKAATTFGNNLEDIRMRQNARNKLYDLENTPGRGLEDAYEILTRMSPDLLKQLGLANLNLDTEAGRNVLLQGLRDIFELINSGNLTPELLGAFTDKGQLLEAILGAKDALDAFKNTVADVTTDFPKAMDVILYEQQYGRGTGVVNSTRTVPPPNDTRPSEPKTTITVAGGITFQITPAQGESGEAILRRVEAAIVDRASRGGKTHMPGIVTEAQ